MVTDATAQRVDAALDGAEDGELAARKLFVGLLWASVAIGAVAHATDGGSAASVAVSAAIGIALAAWLHGLHRVQGWETRGQQTGRLVAMLLGVYGALGAWLVIDPAYLVVLFGVYAVTFGFVDHLPTAALMAAIVTALWIGAWIGYDLPRGAIITPVLVWATLVAVAHVTERIAQQNDERRTLLEQVRSTREQLALAHQETGRLEERERVASEIHDTLAQGFTSIVLLSDAVAAQHETLAPDTLADTMALIGTTARENLTTARRLVEDLGPAELEHAGLADALRSEATKHAERGGGRVDVDIDDDVRRLGGSVEVTFLRVMQEALHNAHKHAAGCDVDVKLIVDAESATLSIVDDGPGFDLSAPATPVAGNVGGSGLGLMRRRVEAVGGELTVESELGRGTAISARVPIDGAGR